MNLLAAACVSAGSRGRKFRSRILVDGSPVISADERESVKGEDKVWAETRGGTCGGALRAEFPTATGQTPVQPEVTLFPRPGEQPDLHQRGDCKKGMARG